MKVDIYTYTYKPEINGVVPAVSGLEQSLTSNKHTVRIFAPKPKKSIVDEKNVFRLLAVAISNQVEQKVALPFNPKHLKKVLSTDADVIHAHTLGTMAFLGLYV